MNIKAEEADMAIWTLVMPDGPCEKCGERVLVQKSPRRPADKGACVLCMARSFEQEGEDKLADLMHALLDDEHLNEEEALRRKATEETYEAEIER